MPFVFLDPIVVLFFRCSFGLLDCWITEIIGVFISVFFGFFYPFFFDLLIVLFLVLCRSGFWWFCDVGFAMFFLVSWSIGIDILGVVSNILPMGHYFSLS